MVQSMVDLSEIKFILFVTDTTDLGWAASLLFQSTKRGSVKVNRYTCIGGQSSR